ncbi:MAG: TonB-dependent receptor [Acidobacteria bacterium]|nr:TonB-dependent receptor [Acidobacteriota bacterium]
MRRSAFVSAVVLCTFLFSSPTLAQTSGNEQDTPPQIRESVTVTAERLEVPLERSGSAVTVLTAEDLDALGVHWLSDALATVPGVVVARSGGPGTITSVFLRGANSNHTLVLMDGVRVNSPTTGAYDFSGLPVSAIERVEIVRGSQSVLYGSEALGGVIHVVTRAGGGVPQFTASLDGGAYGTARGIAAVEGGGDEIAYAATVERFRTDGFSAADANTGNAEDDSYSNTAINARVRAGSGEGLGAEALLNYFDGETLIDGFDFSTGPVDDLDHLQSRRQTIGGAALTYQRGKYSGRLAATISDARLGTVNPNGFNTSSELDTQTTAIELQNDIGWDASNTTVVGGELRNEEAESATQSAFGPGGFDESVDTTEVYALHRLSRATVDLTAGGRFTDHSEFGGHFTYRVTGGWQFAPQVRARASFGTGFRAPSLNDLYFPGFSNPALQPEESEGWDVRLSANLAGDTIEIDATWFRNDVENLIQYLFPIGIVNVGEARSQGLEFGIGWAASSQIRFEANYTFTDAVDVATDEQLLRRPRHTATGQVRYRPAHSVRLVAELRYKGQRDDFGTVGRVELPSYTLLNAAGQVDVGAGLTVLARLENLGDVQYQDVWGYGTAGRSAYVGLRYGVALR